MKKTHFTTWWIKLSTDETLHTMFHVKHSLNRLTLAEASSWSPWQLCFWLVVEAVKCQPGVKLPQCPESHGAWREFSKSNKVKRRPPPHFHIDLHHLYLFNTHPHTTPFYFLLQTHHWQLNEELDAGMLSSGVTTLLLCWVWFAVSAHSSTYSCGLFVYHTHNMVLRLNTFFICSIVMIIVFDNLHFLSHVINLFL